MSKKSECPWCKAETHTCIMGKAMQERFDFIERCLKLAPGEVAEFVSPQKTLVVRVKQEERDD